MLVAQHKKRRITEGSYSYNVRCRMRESVTHASKVCELVLKGRHQRHNVIDSETVQTFTIATRKFFQWHFLFLLAFCKSTRSNNLSLSLSLYLTHFNSVSIWKQEKRIVLWSLLNEASNKRKTQSHIKQIAMTEINWKRKHRSKLMQSGKSKILWRYKKRCHPLKGQ